MTEIRRIKDRQRTNERTQLNCGISSLILRTLFLTSKRISSSTLWQPQIVELLLCLFFHFFIGALDPLFNYPQLRLFSFAYAIIIRIHWIWEQHCNLIIITNHQSIQPPRLLCMNAIVCLCDDDGATSIAIYNPNARVNSASSHLPFIH